MKLIDPALHLSVGLRGVAAQKRFVPASGMTGQFDYVARQPRQPSCQECRILEAARVGYAGQPIVAWKAEPSLPGGVTAAERGEQDALSPRAGYRRQHRPRFPHAADVRQRIEAAQNVEEDAADRREDLNVMMAIDRRRRMADEFLKSLTLSGQFCAYFVGTNGPAEQSSQESAESPEGPVGPHETGNLRCR
jgi:hypothetical protein